MKLNFKYQFCTAFFLILAANLIVCSANRGAGARGDFLKISVDRSKPYLILATPRAQQDYFTAIELAKKVHPEAGTATIDSAFPKNIADLLKKENPYYALIFIKPEELDLQFVYKWLKISSSVDSDPFVDVRSGFISGESPRSVENFLQRIADAQQQKVRVPAVFTDLLGPNELAEKKFFLRTAGSFMIPLLSRKMQTFTITHGREGFSGKDSQAFQAAD